MCAAKGGRSLSGASGSATSDAMRRFSSAGSAVLLQLSVLPPALLSDSCRKLSDSKSGLVWSDLVLMDLAVHSALTLSPCLFMSILSLSPLSLRIPWCVT